MICRKNSPDSQNTVSSVLKKGQIVIIPTDTVYGFSGIVDLNGNTSFETDKKICTVKGRDEGKPLIELIAEPSDIKKYTDDEIPDFLLKKWPGALTVICNVRKDSPFLHPVKTVAFRCPGDLWLRNVIAETGAPIYSTSVNRAGLPVLDMIDEIQAEFEDEVSLIVSDGNRQGSVPSTIVSVTDSNVKVIRQGAVEIN